MDLLSKGLWLMVIAALSTLPSCKSKAPEEAQQGAYLGDGEISDELPVSRVALYQNGVGYFERRGHVDGDVLTLRIRPDQINDILKSLTVIDLGDGHPVSISLPVDRQAVDELAAIPRQIKDEGGVLSLLHALRGARIKVSTGQSVEGRLVGVERMDDRDPNGLLVTTHKATIKTDSGALEIVDVNEITSLHIQDRTLEVGLEKSLDISLNEGSWKPIELKVRMSDAKAKEVLVSYIVSMPVWKPAYRLVLDDDAKGLFQGWAVVDNVSGSNWERVRMSLVAGTPMSFVYDLYTPHFISRPDLTGRGQRQVAHAPVITESAVAVAAYDEAPSPDTAAEYRYEEGKKEDYKKLAKKKKSRRKGRSSGSRGNYDRDKDSGGEELDNFLYEDDAQAVDSSKMAESFGSQSSGEEVSALFEYKIESPVTVPDRASALVNLVNAKGKAQEIALFRPEIWQDYAGLHPYRAVELHNSSGYDLEPGPITLYKDGTFIGEGFLSRTEEGAVAFITFASDPQISLKTQKADSEEAASITKIYGGYIESQIKQVSTVTYEVKNQRKEAIRAVIRRPVRAGWTLSPEPEGLLNAAGTNYIPIDVEPGATKTLTIREETPVTRTLTLDSRLALDLLKVQITEDALDPELKTSLQEVIDKQGQLYEIREELSSLRERQRELSDESWRISNSLEDLKDIKEKSAKKLREQLIKRASELESDIGKTTTRIAELTLQESDLERTLRALFNSITFERNPTP